MNKYGTFIIYQNIDTDEVVEIPLADEDTLNKYANDQNWKEIDGTEYNSKTSTDSGRKED